jgi:peptidoglycan hydrolase CwlO-like protein
MILTVISIAFAIFMGVVNMKRNKTVDDKKEATELTTVIVKLENISNDTKDIKSELRSVRTEVGELRERVIVTEQSSKSLHKRIDNFEERLHDMEHPKA